VFSEKRIVIPRADDCISLLLHTDDARHPNLKEKGHFYLRDSDTAFYSLTAMKKKLCDKYGIQKGTDIFHSWFVSYTDVDIIDTGEYDCYSEKYVAEAQRNADIIHCRLNYVNGSNILLEKLVSDAGFNSFWLLNQDRCFLMRNLFLEKNSLRRLKLWILLECRREYYAEPNIFLLF